MSKSLREQNTRYEVNSETSSNFPLRFSFHRLTFPSPVVHAIKSVYDPSPRRTLKREREKERRTTRNRQNIPTDAPANSPDYITELPLRVRSVRRRLS